MMTKHGKAKRFTAMTLISGLIVLALGACSGKDATPAGTAAPSQAGQSAQSASTTISVAAINNFPPFDFKKDGKLTGFDIELMELIAKEENLKVEWKEMKFDGIIPALQAKQVDAAISFIGAREDRKKVVDFTETYFSAGYALVVKKDGPIQKMEDLKGKTVSATQGTEGVGVTEKLAQQYGAKQRLLQSSDTLYLDVESGNADALVIDFPAVAYKLKQEGDKAKLRIVGDKLTNEDAAIAVVKGKTDLLNKLNDGLKKVRENGAYQKLYDSYFGTK
ncbi:basic amino acid ABC transporter substrate-binding protein [Gordoniibacillus kamchatkensis]|uniref:basic amino acid ABC transporter substrate-binding protein n=1 Tax=Gordoniibacillus kamchatkensis TaxID=1590651 RepID=UPI000695EC09|nr:basic amino acid ABC transporter substrate-binding protein [Paenibacillus sp. VKM B-2647]